MRRASPLVRAVRAARAAHDLSLRGLPQRAAEPQRARRGLAARAARPPRARRTGCARRRRRSTSSAGAAARWWWWRSRCGGTRGAAARPRRSGRGRRERLRAAAEWLLRPQRLGVRRPRRSRGLRRAARAPRAQRVRTLTLPRASARSTRAAPPARSDPCSPPPAPSPSLGLDAVPVEVEAHVAPGVPAFTIVGLPDKAVQEARERVRSGIASAELAFPLRRVTVNLAPGTVRKEGAGFDLAIALAILGGDGAGPGRRGCAGSPPLGELALDARVRPARGTLAAAEAAAALGLDGLVCAAESAARGRAGRGLRADRAARRSSTPWRCCAAAAAGRRRVAPPSRERLAAVADLADVRGQAARAAGARDRGGRRAQPAAGRAARRGQDDAGAPPAGHAAAARRAEAVEVTRIHSAAGALARAASRCVARPPFRAPHHTASRQALVGGGPALRPGELSLAHRGVLFLDELPEFTRDAIESLRAPLEDGEVVVVARPRPVCCPTRTMLVAAMNPCPCGAPAATGCTCAPARVEAYRRRVSGPLLDRVDLGVRLERPAMQELRGGAPGGRPRPCGRGSRRPARASARAGGEVNGRLAPAELQRRGGARRRRRGPAGPRQPSACGSRRGRSTGRCGWRARSPTSTGRDDVRRRAPRRGARPAAGGGRVTRLAARRAGLAGAARRARRRPPPALHLRPPADGARLARLLRAAGRRASSARARPRAGGAAFARRLAHDLARVGACVVSGLGAGHRRRRARGRARRRRAHDGRAGLRRRPRLPARQRRRWPLASPRTARWSASTSPGTPPAPWRFPARNRIVAALADAVVVVEASARSGALITAALALDLGRDVLAVPGTPWHGGHAGQNGLLRDGAAPVTSVEDVLVALGLDPAGVRARRPGRGRRDAARCWRRSAACRRRRRCWRSASASTPAALSAALVELELAGAVARERDGTVVSAMTARRRVTVPACPSCPRPSAPARCWSEHAVGRHDRAGRRPRRVRLPAARQGRDRRRAARRHRHRGAPPGQAPVAGDGRRRRPVAAPRHERVVPRRRAAGAARLGPVRAGVRGRHAHRAARQAAARAGAARRARGSGSGPTPRRSRATRSASASAAAGRR